MSQYFHSDANLFVMAQRARKFRLGFTIFAIMGAFGIAMMILLSHARFATTLACDHATGQCTLTEANQVTPLALAPFKAVRVIQRPSGGGAVLALERTAFPNYTELCGSRDADAASANQARAAELTAFLGDPQHAPVTIACTSQDVNMPNPVVLAGLFVLGIVVIGFLFRRFVLELEARFDRRSQRLIVTTRHWFKRSVDCDRPLADIAKLWIGVIGGPYGSRYYNLNVAFKDGASARVWAPAAAARSAIQERSRRLAQFLDHPDAVEDRTEGTLDGDKKSG